MNIMKRSYALLLTEIAVIGLGLGITFAAGLLYGRNTADSAPAVAANPSGVSFQGAMPPGAPRVGGEAVDVSTGTIESLADGTLTLRGQNGMTTVKLAEDTRYTRTDAVQPSDLQVGQTVNVIGSRDEDGSVQARSVTIGTGGDTFQQAPGGKPVTAP